MAEITLHPSSNISASGENTTAQLTAPSGKTTADFVAGRIQDDENPADAVDITTDDYTEMEWSMIATAEAFFGADYEFRLTISGTELTTYSVYPILTVIGNQSIFSSDEIHGTIFSGQVIR